MCCRLNVSLNELYPDKTNKNKDYIFVSFFFLSVTLYSVLAANCYWHFSVNKFKIFDKTNKIYTIFVQTKLLFVGLSFCLSAETWTNSEYITGAGECGIKACRSETKEHCPAQTSTSQIRLNLSREERWLTRRLRWDRQDDGGRVSKRNVKAPDLNQGCPRFFVCGSTFQMRNSMRSTKWKVNKW